MSSRKCDTLGGREVGDEGGGDLGGGYRSELTLLFKDSYFLLCVYMYTISIQMTS